jgi:hypothetical protein
VAYAEGQVQILQYGSKVPVRAELGMALFRGDQIRTVNGKCQINITAGGILRLSTNTTMMFATKDEENQFRFSVIARKMQRRWMDNFRQLVGQAPEEMFLVRETGPDIYDPPPPELVAQRSAEDTARLAARPGEDPAVAEYRSLLPAVLQKEKKPWHTRTEFLANALKTGNGYRVAYKTYCLIEKGPDAGKDHPCYELDTVIDLGELKKAVADMKRRLGR